jgi:hypothetical protein
LDDYTGFWNPGEEEEKKGSPAVDHGEQEKGSPITGHGEDEKGLPATEMAAEACQAVDGWGQRVKSESRGHGSVLRIRAC